MLVHSMIDEGIKTPNLLPRRSRGLPDVKDGQSECKLGEAKVPSANVEIKKEGIEKLSLQDTPDPAAESEIRSQEEIGEENRMQKANCHTAGCPDTRGQVEEGVLEMEAELQEAKKKYIREKRSQSGGLTSRSVLTGRSARRTCSRHFSDLEATLVQAAESDASAQQGQDHVLEPVGATVTFGKDPVQEVGDNAPELVVANLTLDETPVQEAGDNAVEPVAAAFIETALRGCSCTYMDERNGNRTIVQYRVSQDLTELIVEEVVKRRFALRGISRTIPLASIMDVDTIENCDFCLPAKVVACLSSEEKERFSMVFYEGRNGAILSFCVLHRDSASRDIFVKSLTHLASKSK